MRLLLGDWSRSVVGLPLAEGMRAMAIWSTNRKRGLVPGTIGIRIAVIEYDANTKSYQAISSTAYPPADFSVPTTSYRRLESAPVSLVRPFVLAALTQRNPYRGPCRPRSSANDGEEQ